MQEVVRSLSEHPLAAITVCFALLMILYFLFKRIIKLALVMIIVAVAIGGYYYFREPQSKPADLKEAVEKARIETGRAVEKGREVIGKGKEVIEKGRELVEKGKVILDKGMEKGKEVVDRGKGAVDEIGNLLGGEQAADKK